jgi:hypothetical protein
VNLFLPRASRESSKSLICFAIAMRVGSSTCFRTVTIDNLPWSFTTIPKRGGCIKPTRVVVNDACSELLKARLLSVASWPLPASTRRRSRRPAKSHNKPFPAGLRAAQSQPPTACGSSKTGSGSRCARGLSTSRRSPNRWTSKLARVRVRLSRRRARIAELTMPNRSSKSAAVVSVRLLKARADISASLVQALDETGTSHEAAARSMSSARAKRINARTVGAWARGERAATVEVILASSRVGGAFRRALCTEHHDPVPVAYVARKHGGRK